MLIKFSVSNFLSFKDTVTLSMVASTERIHAHHVVRAPTRSHPNLLRMAAIYGPNASGKSNLVKALKFVQDLVVQGQKPDASIPIQRFRLASSCSSEPSRFEIEVRVKSVNYAYSFTLDTERVLEEVLSTTTNSSAALLFSRTTSPEGNVKVQFGPFASRLSEKDKRFMEFVAQGTRPNQLFLHESIERNLDRFRPVYNWFRRTLQIIEPSTDYSQLEIRLESDESFRSFLDHILKTAGTGISSVRVDEVGTDVVTEFPRELLENMKKQSLADNVFLFLKGPAGRRLALAKREDEVRALKLTTLHGLHDSEVSFEIHEESDGTQRLFDLVPMLHELTVGTRDAVYVVDEIGRSMHPHLTNMIVELHLDEANASKTTQLIVTTHETHLLDLDLLRRDEIWFMERKLDESSDLYSLSDFQPRYDKDVRRDYLAGRYGGIPFIGNVHQLRLPGPEASFTRETSRVADGS